MKIVLIGYRGTGKTTVGQLLAQQLGWTFIDTDPLIEQRAGMPIRDIFATFGEQYFRDLESSVIASLDREAPGVVSVGGGAILRQPNVQALRAHSLVVWLTGSAETLHQRIRGDATTEGRRPNLTNFVGLAEIQHLLAVREPLYRAAADIQVDTESRTARQIAETILAEFDRRRDKGG